MELPSNELLTNLQKDRVIESLIQWYKQWKEKAISSEGDIMKKFMALEFETRFPFLKEVKI